MFNPWLSNPRHTNQWSYIFLPYLLKSNILFRKNLVSPYLEMAPIIMDILFYIYNLLPKLSDKKSLYFSKR